MEGLLGRKSFPLGFRFHPTDEELLLFYLKRKVLGKSLGPRMISEVDVYKFAPWDLPALACLKTRDLNWYFFCPRAKKYPNGGKANRATEVGYWKSTGNDRPVKYRSRPVGKIKTLIFHRGKAPKGERTDWVMHEYRLEDLMLTERGVPQNSYVICKIYEKSGLGPKNGENYGARFVEEEWDSDIDDDNVQERHSGLVLHDTNFVHGDSPDGSVSVITSSLGAPNVASPVDTPFVGCPADTPFVAVADNNVASPGTTAAFMGTPCITAASMGTRCVTAASMGTPCITAASMGTPYATATSVGMPNVTPVSVGMPNVAAASVGSVSVAPISLGSAAEAAPLTEDELDKLLMHFTEEVEDVGDIYNGLGDLADPSAQHIDWGDLADPSAQNFDRGDCFIEIDDLN